MEFQTGQYYEMQKKVTQEDVLKFAEISGDFNPIHVDEEYAKNSIFGQRIAHGMLGAAYVSTVIGMKFPGEGTIYMGQNLKFVRPVYPGDELTVRVEIKELLEKNRAKLATTVKNGKEETVIEGEALVKLP